MKNTILPKLPPGLTTIYVDAPIARAFVSRRFGSTTRAFERLENVHEIWVTSPQRIKFRTTDIDGCENSFGFDADSGAHIKFVVRDAAA